MDHLVQYLNFKSNCDDSRGAWSKSMSGLNNGRSKMDDTAKGDPTQLLEFLP